MAVEEFLKNPCWEQLIGLRKDDAFLVGQNLELDVRRAMRKSGIIKVIAEHMVDNDIFEEERLSELQVDVQDMTPAQLEVEKAKIAAWAKAKIAGMRQEMRLWEMELKVRNDRTSVEEFEKWREQERLRRQTKMVEEENMKLWEKEHIIAPVIIIEEKKEMEVAPVIIEKQETIAPAVIIEEELEDKVEPDIILVREEMISTVEMEKEEKVAPVCIIEKEQTIESVDNFEEKKEEQVLPIFTLASEEKIIPGIIVEEERIANIPREREELIAPVVVVVEKNILEEKIGLEEKIVLEEKNDVLEEEMNIKKEEDKICLEMEKEAVDDDDDDIESINDSDDSYTEEDIVEVDDDNESINDSDGIGEASNEDEGDDEVGEAGEAAESSCGDDDDDFDGGGNLMKPPISTETGDDITSDIQEAISEVASSHSVGSLENDNDNFSDMISANVSGRGTPNVSGRDTPLSQAESVEERRAPDLPETVQKQNREDVTERFGKFEIKAELEKDETKSTVSDTWSTDVLASDSEGPDQNQLERLEEVTEEMVRQNLLGVAEPVSEVSETASDAWSTDVLASDTEEKQAELLQEIDQDDVSSVTDRSVTQDEIDNAADTPDRNEVTPLASGRESPVEERELEGLGAVGGMSGHHHHHHHHRHRRSYGTDRVTFKANKSPDFFKRSPTTKSPVSSGLIDIGPDGSLDGFKLLNVPRQRLSATFKQAQGKVTAMLSALDHHSRSRFMHPFQENTLKNYPAYDPTPLRPIPQAFLISESSDVGFTSLGEEEHSLSTSKDSGIMDSPQSETNKINEYGSILPVGTGVANCEPISDVDLRFSEQQNARLDEQRLSAALRVFDPLSSSNSTATGQPEDSGGSSSSSSGGVAESATAASDAREAFNQTSRQESMTTNWASQLIDEVFTPVKKAQNLSGISDPAANVTSSLSQSSKRGDIATPFPIRSNHHSFEVKNSLDLDQDFDDDKGEKKKSFFKSFKEKLNKGMKKRGKNERDDFFPEELGACGDGFDGGGNLMKPPICTETGDDILAKYRKKPNVTTSQSLNMNEESTKEKHHSTKEEENEVPYFDLNNLENCFAFSDARRKLRLVLSVGDYQNCSVGYHSSSRWIPTSPCDEGAAADGSQWKENDLVHILRAQLAEAINLRNKEMVAQLHEVIRCIRLFDNDGCMKLFRSLAEEYKGRSHYVAYLTRSKQGLLTSFHYLQGLLQRVQRDKEICNSHMSNVCVQRFIESRDKLLSNFMSDFQRLTMSDEKANLVDQFLRNLYHSMETDPLWQGSSEAQLEDGQISLERYVMGRIYTHAMFPNGDGDIMRDQLIHQHIKKLSQVISPTHKDLCIPKIYQFECPWPAAQREIHMINAYKTPKDKVQCVYRCSLCIMNLLSMANDRRVPAADDFFPVLIYVIIKANPPCLLSTIQYVNSFYGERVAGEEQYWWMQFFSAVKFIKTMD